MKKFPVLIMFLTSIFASCSPVNYSNTLPGYAIVALKDKAIQITLKHDLTFNEIKQISKRDFRRISLSTDCKTLIGTISSVTEQNYIVKSEQDSEDVFEVPIKNLGRAILLKNGAFVFHNFRNTTNDFDYPHVYYYFPKLQETSLLKLELPALTVADANENNEILLIEWIPDFYLVKTNPTQLLLFRTDTQTLETLMDYKGIGEGESFSDIKLINPKNARWSPDSKHIVVQGNVSAEHLVEKTKLYLYDRDSQTWEVVQGKNEDPTLWDSENENSPAYFWTQDEWPIWIDNSTILFQRSFRYKDDKICTYNINTKEITCNVFPFNSEDFNDWDWCSAVP
jgi:hypothetical protein